MSAWFLKFLPGVQAEAVNWGSYCFKGELEHIVLCGTPPINMNDVCLGQGFPTFTFLYLRGPFLPPLIALLEIGLQ